MNKITKEQEEFLNKCTNGTWELNHKTGLVDIDGSFDCSRMGLSDFMGIEFGEINGVFNCASNRLVSLKGGPQDVNGEFDCSNNQLVSLEGGPQEVGGGFDCSNNRLVNLEGAPQKVGWDFVCDPLPLRGCPDNLLDVLFFLNNKKYYLLRGFIIEIANGLAHEIYLKKMI
jgi:hypothetical protein